jgi:hypothetical protein
VPVNTTPPLPNPGSSVPSGRNSAIAAGNPGELIPERPATRIAPSGCTSAASGSSGSEDDAVPPDPNDASRFPSGSNRRMTVPPEKYGLKTLPTARRSPSAG